MKVQPPQAGARREGNEEMTTAKPVPAFRAFLPSFLPGMTRAGGGNEGIEGWIREDWRLRAFRPLGGLGRIASWRLARSWSPRWTSEYCLGRHHEANRQGRPHHQSARWRRLDGENDNGQGRAGQGGATRAAGSRPAVLIQTRLEIVVEEIMAPGDYRRLDWEPRLTLDVDARILPRPVSRM